MDRRRWRLGIGFWGVIRGCLIRFPYFVRVIWRRQVDLSARFPAGRCGWGRVGLVTRRLGHVQAKKVVAKVHVRLTSEIVHPMQQAVCLSGSC